MNQQILPQAELVTQRLAGKLPHIDINGTDFTIDLRLQELRETEMPWNHISIMDLEPSLDGDDQLFLYDTQKHCAYELDDNITELPEHVVLVALPDDFTLDPVAAARAVGYEETKFLDEYPIKQFLIAGITPLKDTFLPKMIEENLSRQNNSRGYIR
ncbi:hypothetical protein QN344_05765 [Mucilaginibacter sp. 5B2]|nr:hypothetical protein [Mucilaginibacter sp. 5B2]